MLAQEKPPCTEAQFAEFIMAIKSGATETVANILQRCRNDIVNKLQIQFRQPSLYFAALAPQDDCSAEMMALILKAGANVHFKDHNEQSVLFYVCREGKEKCLDLLLANGLSLNQVDRHGQTPVFYVADANRLNIINKFSQGKGSFIEEAVNHIDTLASQTCLYYAVRKRHLEMCKALVERGCDVSVQNSMGKTAADVAKKCKFNEISDYLFYELRKLKGDVKGNSANEQSNVEKRRKKEEDHAKLPKLTYKLVQINNKGELHDMTEEEVRQLLKNDPQLEAYFSNPELIPQSQIEAAEEENWQKVALKIVNLCWKLKGAYWFYEPVDPVKYNIMDYFDRILKPMDLGTIKKFLTYNYYSKASEFVNDMELIWKNCFDYNGREHDISRCAEQLQSSFTEYVKTHGLSKYL